HYSSSCFSCLRHPRDLPSFPTRRSSDLCRVALRQHIAGADIGMTGERQLRLRREDAHPGVMLRIVRRQHEGGLGQVELGCQRLRSEEHTSELQSLTNLVCRLLLEKKKTN